MENQDLFKWLALVIMVFMLSTAGCSMYKADKATEMVNKGADPLAVDCLLYRSNAATCTILAARR